MRPLGRFRGNIRNDLGKIGINVQGLIRSAQAKDCWIAILNIGLTLNIRLIFHL